MELPIAKNQLYLERYIKLMKWALTQTFYGYTEKHHIIPDCFYIINRAYKRNIKQNPNYKSLGFLIGDSNDKNNLINLSPRVHFIAHYLLYKAYDNYQLTKAFLMMSNNPNVS